MTANLVETGQGVEAMASFGANPTSPLAERTESPKHHKKLPMNGVTEGVDSGDKAPKLETTLSGEGENSSRTSSQGQEGGTRGVKRSSRRKSEAEGLLEGMDTPQRLRLVKSAKSRGDSGTKPTHEENNENEGVVESSMFKQVKFENGTARAQSGSSYLRMQSMSLCTLAYVPTGYLESRTFHTCTRL